MKNHKTLVVIAGPTAVGKTALAIELAKHYNTVILSADSRQFYAEMNIGTAKPDNAELQEATHYFIGTHSIKEDYNAGKFESEAIPLLEELFKTKDIVLLAGGSGLYINAVCEGFDELPEADAKIRSRIDNVFEKEGISGLQKMLKELDPLYYEQADIENPQRLSRALEVCLSAGKPYSSLRHGKRKTRDFSIIKIGINMPREKLYERIDQRVDQMMKNGLLEEVKGLLPMKDKNALQTVGYRELFDHLEGKTDLKSAVALIKQKTRNFAKRQLTWFRKDKAYTWFQPEQEKEIIGYIDNLII